MGWTSGHSLRKALADVGVRHSAKHAYRPMRRPGEPPILLTDERLRVHRNVFWFGAAFIYGITGVVTLGRADRSTSSRPRLGVAEEAFSVHHRRHLDRRVADGGLLADHGRARRTGAAVDERRSSESARC